MYALYVNLGTKASGYLAWDCPAPGTQQVTLTPWQRGAKRFSSFQDAHAALGEYGMTNTSSVRAGEVTGYVCEVP